MSTIATAATAAKVAAARTGSHYDLAIVGTGAVGLALACAVTRSPQLRHLRVALVGDNQDEGASIGDAHVAPPANDKTDPATRFSNRVVALSRFSRDFLANEADAWRRIPRERIAPVEKMNIWQHARHIDKVTIDQSDLNDEESHSFEPSLLAQIVETPQIIAALRASLRESVSENFATFGPLKGSHVDDFVRYLECHDRNTGSPTLISAALVIGADGARSAVRKIAGIRPVIDISNGSHALVATLIHEYDESMQRVAYQRFLPTGPIALLPLGDSSSSPSSVKDDLQPPENLSSLVWSLPSAAHAKALESLNETEFVACLNAALTLPAAEVEALLERLVDGSFENAEDESVASYVSWRVRSRIDAGENEFGPGFLPASVTSFAPQSRARFALRTMHAETYCSKRMVLLGDAAHTIHPLAGQGLNLGLGDAAALLRRLEHAAQLGEDPGCSQTALGKHYEKSRYLRNFTALAFCDATDVAFRTNWAPVRMARRLAMRLFDSCPPLKRASTKYVSHI